MPVLLVLRTGTTHRYYAPVWEQFSDFLAYLHEHLFPILPQVAPNEETCALSILVHVHRQI
jgi:hypothetical protein